MSSCYKWTFLKLLSNDIRRDRRVIMRNQNITKQNMQDCHKTNNLEKRNGKIPSHMVSSRLLAHVCKCLNIEINVKKKFKSKINESWQSRDFG